jgi:hypothetical protein
MTARETGAVERPDAAIEQLRDHQEQLDFDGVMVGVSRQALDETLAYVEALSRPQPTPAGEIVAYHLATLSQVEDMLANGAHYGDDPECHPLYPNAVAARQFLAKHIEQQAATIAELRDRTKLLADELDGLLPYLASHNWRLDRLYDAIAKARATLERTRGQ